MRIYMISGYGSYASGLAIVAAKSQKQALATLKAAKLASWDNYWGLEYHTATAIRSATIGGETRVLATHSYVE